MKNRIYYLTGFMAAGKSTIGPILANTLGWDFFDLDKEIEKIEEKKIVQIFDENGERHFRKLEYKVLNLLSGKSKVIIALGGGTIANDKNLKTIESTGKLIYLNSSIETVFKRLKYKRDRPALFPEIIEDGNDEKLLEKIKTLYEQRKKYYDKADFVVETDLSNVGKTVDVIARFIEKDN
ncbi:MAG: shikimate kinase [Promethearchaeota archaeon]|jgi:shikimate kinase